MSLHLSNTYNIYMYMYMYSIHVCTLILYYMTYLKAIHNVLFNMVSFPRKKSESEGGKPILEGGWRVMGDFLRLSLASGALYVRELGFSVLRL